MKNALYYTNFVFKGHISKLTYLIESFQKPTLEVYQLICDLYYKLKNGTGILY